ncbi:LOW QUALITY PROTEIN: bromodomain-containing protein 7 [Drosophila eugracilis]|uniref:LOW QUALITY PROTEIN: bromodomain-containing protein 7 n=1 Tax=Drosophila eugracilis TaxID=29029 RepID=UPI0007E76C51|nr:LOW QUALITY PROTEIN: bromodomain-containing protein 7 [Drosophila eugracilis]
MGSSKKHKKNKSERREKYEEYSQHQDPAQLQRGLKLILKVGSNATPEYSANSPMVDGGPPTAAEAMMSPVPEELQDHQGHRERHKKSKKKKKKKDREKKHKHHKEKRHRSRDRHRDAGSDDDMMPSADDAACSGFAPPSVAPPTVDPDSSQDGFSFMDDDQSQPLPENILFFAGITTDNSPSNCPVTKPIAPRKLDDILMGSSPNSSSLQSSSLGLVGSSPTKPLPDLLIPSPSTPGGANSLNALTPKGLEAPKTPSSSSESGREPRSCVLKLKQQKSPLNKLLEHLLRFLEKRDPHQFFAWPVTDDMAPGYSSIISRPMDFSTMRQKIDDHEYAALTEFSDDFKLMCENAIKYNHVDTVYNKAAKRLLQVGMKHLQPENLMRSLKPLSGYMRELTAKELGFELSSNDLSREAHDSADEGASTGAEEPPTPAQLEEEERKRALRLENAPKTHFEPYVDDLTGEEILAQVQNAAQQAKQRVNAKKNAHKMGFLRQTKDGTTTLNLLTKDENEGPERVVTIGDLVGKLQTGSTQLQARQMDKRNAMKIVKPLSYGAFASFAPTFDSRFSTLSAEETQLVLHTYGDASSAEYAESILQFTKDSSYGTTIANGLLDILTNGEHSKSLDELYNMQLHSYEQREIGKCFEQEEETTQQQETAEQIEQEYEKYKNTHVDFKRLQSLGDLGIDVSFLDSMETEIKNFELNRRMHEHLSQNLTLIEKLRVTQHDRLSQPLPNHHGLVQPAGQEETQTAQQLTQQISDLAKKLPPSAIADPYALRKAMGMSYAGLPPPPAVSPRVQLPELLQQPVALPQLQPVAMEIDETDEQHGGGDLENELREFLESGSGLHSANPADDNSIVAQLLLN